MHSGMTPATGAHCCDGLAEMQPQNVVDAPLLLMAVDRFKFNKITFDVEVLVVAWC